MVVGIAKIGRPHATVPAARVHRSEGVVDLTVVRQQQTDTCRLVNDDIQDLTELRFNISLDTQ